MVPGSGGSVLSPRGVHTACVVGRHLVVYGGSADFDREIQQCTRYYADAFLAETGGKDCFFHKFLILFQILGKN